MGEGHSGLWHAMNGVSVLLQRFPPPPGMQPGQNARADMLRRLTAGGFAGLTACTLVSCLGIFIFACSMTIAQDRLLPAAGTPTSALLTSFLLRQLREGLDCKPIQQFPSGRQPSSLVCSFTCCASTGRSWGHRAGTHLLSLLAGSREAEGC